MDDIFIFFRPLLVSGDHLVVGVREKSAAGVIVGKRYKTRLLVL